MKKEYFYGLLGIIIGAIVTIGISGSFSTQKSSMISETNSSEKNQTARSSMMGNIDAHFIEQMIPHHEDAITMAKLAQTNATHPQMKQLAENIIASQGKEITQMNQWYKQWYGRELPTGNAEMQHHGMMGNTSGMHMGMMGSSTDITRLETASNFDKTFIEDMIPHHQMAVMMASMLKAGTTRTEMKNLADAIIIAQTKEIDDMRTWYQEWGYEN